MGCVYIAHSPSGRYYVGRTTRTIAERWKGHGRDAARGRKSPFYDAIRKYGADSFTLETLAEASDLATLDSLERLWIICLSAREIGYNLTAGGTGYRGIPWNKGIKASESQREKMRAAAKRKWARPEYRAMMIRVHAGKPSPKLGIPTSAKTREKLRRANLGKVLSRAHRQAIAAGVRRARNV